LYQSFILPNPAILNAISALKILTQKITTSEMMNDIGNGRIKGNMTTIAIDTNNQIR